MVDLETIWLTIYGIDLGNRMVDVGDAIVKRCVEPKARVPPRGTLASTAVMSVTSVLKMRTN